MVVAFLYGLNHNRYSHIMNKLHNAFTRGRKGYPKKITTTYYPEINWNGKPTLMEVPPNYGVDFLTDNRYQHIEVHAAKMAVILNRGSKPLERHIYGRNQYTNKCTNKKKSYASSNKQKQTKTVPHTQDKALE